MGIDTGKVVKGGLYLTLRQIFAAGLSMVSILIIARILGPSNYGIVTVTFGFFFFFAFSGRLGLNTYLIRQPELDEDIPRQVLAFYNTVGVALCILLWLAAPLAGWWTKEPNVTLALRCIIPGIWLHSVSRAIIGMLEREIRFVEVGLIEFVSQICNYLFAISCVLILNAQNSPYIFLGPILGMVLQFAVQALFAQYLYPMKWSWQWKWSDVKPALQYGLTFSLSDSILNVRTLRVPVLVSSFLGVEAAGITSVAIRLVDQLALLRLVIRRMSISVIAKILADTEATRKAISKGMAYQALLIGPICAGFACIAAWIIPWMFGESWRLSAEIFPLIALGSLVSAIFDLHASTLYAAGYNRDVAIANLWYVGMLWVTAFLLLPVLGLWGYGISEILALPSFFVIHRSFSKFYGQPNYRPAMLLILAAVAPLMLGPILSININPAIGFVVFLLSYGLFLGGSSTLRRLPIELWETWRRKRKK